MFGNHNDHDSRKSAIYYTHFRCKYHYCSTEHYNYSNLLSDNDIHEMWLGCVNSLPKSPSIVPIQRGSTLVLVRASEQKEETTAPRRGRGDAHDHFLPLRSGLLRLLSFSVSETCVWVSEVKARR